MQLSLPIARLAPVQGTEPPSPSGRIYCNRSLRMDRVKVVGFDMDYTLAVYRQSEIDRLSIEATVRKLVERGYPEDLLTMDFRTDFPIRGLLIDRKLGHVLKMDRYRYVKRAYHGLRELSSEERRKAYQARRLRSQSKRYHWVDTLYGLSEVAVFAAAVEKEGDDPLEWLRDSIPGEPGVDYPIFSAVEQTQFSCEGKVFGGESFLKQLISLSHFG